MGNCIAIFKNIMWSNYKVVQSVEKVLENEKPIFFLISMPHGKVQRNPKANVGKGHLLRSQNGNSWSILLILLFCTKHSSSLAAWAANTRCLRLVLHQLCLSGHQRHRGTYASIFFHLDVTVLHPSVGDDSAAAFWDWLLPHKVGFRLVILIIVPYVDGHTSAVILKRWSVSCDQ